MTNQQKPYQKRLVGLVISFFLTVMVFFYVKIEVQNNDLSEIFNNVSEETTETVADVPVHVQGDIDQLYVSGIPDAVTVELHGSKNVIRQILESKNFQVVTEDLDNLGTGVHYIQLSVQGLSDNVSARISPSTVKITISRLESQTFPIEVEVQNPNSVASGSEVLNQYTDPQEITLTGSVETLASVAKVYASVQLPDGQSDNYRTEATVLIEDANGKLLNLTADPATVTVVVEVGSQGKQVPIALETYNGAPDIDYQVALQNGRNTVELFGDQNALNGVNEVSGQVDLSGIREDTTQEIDLNVPQGIERISPEKVSVSIQATAKNQPARNDENSTNDDNDASPNEATN
ncbi:MAG: CdaR family protein [Aerococcus sp.]|nr:CdaR family protein [Aerococcus sp.]